MEFLIRIATRQDAETINALFVQMLCAVYGQTEETGYPAGSLEAYFCGGDDCIFVAEQQGETIAYLALEVHREEESFVYCDDFCVREDLRGRGIGSALLSEAEDYARRIGLDTMMLHVQKHNRAAIGFYVHRGFSVLSEEDSRLRMILHPGPKRAAERVARMQAHLDVLQQAVREGQNWHAPGSQLAGRLQELMDYYENGAWLEDFERDERGELPKNLKRGVLSEDAVYDLLCETDLEGSAVLYEDL